MQGLNQNVREAPAGLLPSNIVFDDLHSIAKHLDERYLNDNPGAQLSPLLPQSEFIARARKKVLESRAKPYNDKYKTFSSMKVAAELADTALFGPGTWTHEPADVGPVADRLQLGIAQAIAASVPDTGDDKQAAMDWQILVRDALSKPNAAHETDTLQRLAATSDTIAKNGGARAAVAELLGAGERYHGQYAALFASLQTQFRGKAGAAQAAPQAAASSAATATADQGARAGGGVTFADAPPDGGGAGVRTGAAGASSSAAPLLSPTVAAERGATGAEVANAKTISIFQQRYTPLLGRQLLDAPPERWLPLVNSICADPHWRRALISMSEQGAAMGIADPFLEVAVNMIAEGPHKREAAGTAVLVADVGYAQQLVSEAIQGAAMPDLANNANAVLGPLVATEMTAILAAASFQGTIDRLAVAVQQAQAAGPQHAGGPPALQVKALLHAMLRVARAKQELGLGVINRDGPLAQALSALPADPYALFVAAYAASASAAAAASAEGGQQHQPAVPNSSVFEAGLKLRQLALHFFTAKGGRDELYPEESQARARADGGDGGGAAGGTASGIVPPSKPSDVPAALLSSVEGTAAGQDTLAAETEERAVKAGCARHLSAGDAAAALQCVGALRDVMYDAATVAQLDQSRQEAAKLAAGGADTDPDGAYASEAQSTDATLVAYAFVSRLMRQPDVLALLLHLLFHPAVVIDDAAAEALTGQANGTEQVAVALGWAVTCGSKSIAGSLQRTALRGTLGGQALEQLLGLTDCAVPSQLLSAPVENTGIAGTGADDVTTLQVVAGHLVEASRAVKQSGPLQSLLSMAQQSHQAGQAALESLAREESSLALRGLMHPAIAAGILHWCRQMLVQPGMADDARVLKLMPIYVKLGLLLAQRWPLLAPSVLAMLRQGLHLAPNFVDAAALKPLREGVADALVDLALGSGYVLPVMDFIQAHIGYLEISLMRRILSRLLGSLAISTLDGHPPSLSLDFALALVRAMGGLQARLVSLHQTTKAPLESIVTADMRDAAVGAARDAFKHVAAALGTPNAMSGKQMALVEVLRTLEGTMAKYGNVL